MVRYCRERKASAPSRMAPAISCISGLPVSADRTCRASTQATASASTLMPRTTINTAWTPITPPVSRRLLGFGEAGQWPVRRAR
jgi:hypothetical protein